MRSAPRWSIATPTFHRAGSPVRTKAPEQTFDLHDDTGTPGADMLPAPIQATDGGHDDLASALIRCVVAAETYRVTGQLPDWVRDPSQETSRNNVERAGWVV